MRRVLTTILVIAVAASLPLLAQRIAGSDFLPAAAKDLSPSADAAPGPAAVALVTADVVRARVVDVPPETVISAGAVPLAAALSTPPSAVPTSDAASDGTPPTPVAIRSAAPTPVRTPTPTVAPTPVPATAAPVAASATCPETWFCYLRLGIAGPIVPYSDCSGATDIGTNIRSFTCLSPFYLMGHAYTQFGQLTQWRAGDIVSASGRQFTITGAFTQSSCAPPAQAIAPLSLQTSLTSSGCGSVLVVQGR